MGKVNVYLPDDLERAVRDAGVPISSVCQSALRDAVDAVSTIRADGDLAAAQLTPRLRAILATRPATALELLGAIVLHGENLGARVLVDLGVELPPPRSSKAIAKRVGRSSSASSASTEVREVLVAAYRVALELQHNYLGAEHVVVALAQDDSPTASLFAALGLDERSVRARVVRLLTNPWRADAPGASPPPPDRLDRFEAELQRMTAELAQLRSSAKLRGWPPTTSS